MQPELWDRVDNIHDAGDAFEFDAALVMSKIKEDERDDLLGGDFDFLYERASFCGLAPHHNGPFTVQIDEDDAQEWFDANPFDPEAGVALTSWNSRHWRRTSASSSRSWTAP